MAPTNTVSWSDLPFDLVGGVADRITGHADFARFRSVCPSWRSASAVHAARRRIPLLLVPTAGSWSLADGSISQTPMPTSRSLPFRFASLSFRFASPRGWAFSVTIDFAVTLQNPFTGASESLPALPSPFRVYRSTLQNMLWDRSPDAVMVSPGPGKGAYFCRLPAPDGGLWSPVAGCSQAADTSSITYCDGTFYLLDGRTRRIMAVDGTTFAVASVIEPPDMVAPSPTRSWRTPETTLVASSGELLLMVRSHLLFKAGCRNDSESEGLFKAFRADSRSPAAGWSEIAGGDIGDRAVFVDHLRGFCVEANGVNGLRRNCMYVASTNCLVDDECGMDVLYGVYSVSVLDLADLTTQNLSHGNLMNCRYGRHLQWPTWFMPNLH
jgi:hypothetical protein